MQSKDAIKRGVYGRIRIWDRDEVTGALIPRFQQFNQIQATWGYIAAQQIGFKRPSGRLDYSIAAMYFEYENTVNAEDPVTAPTYEVDEGLSYYDELADTADRDFLRIPLSQEPTLGIESEFEDLFTPGLDGNKLTFSAQTAGLAGVHGKEFSNDVNSKLFGVALVATPVADDRTQDVIFARTYFAVDDQVVKALSHQAFIQWDIVFLP